MTKPVQSWWDQVGVVTENSPEALALSKEGRFGTELSDGRVRLSLLEAFYLVEKEKIVVLDGKNKKLSLHELRKKCSRQDHDFVNHSAVFTDLRSRGFTVKTALKFGGNFRVYDRGTTPGAEHSKWVVFVVREGSTFSWHEYSAKNRVAHSTKKRLLIAVVDDEGSVSYWESRWMKL